jgi:4-amino-4-deoxy-L-arabinose transferase-like glycosyltransferase
MAELWYTWAMAARRRWWAEIAAWVKSRPVLIWIVPVTTVALVLRLARLGFQPLWWDEGWSLYFATSDPGAVLRLTAVDIHPPLYYLLLHLWISLFGPGPASVRLLSVLIGVAAVPLIYLVGRWLFDHKTALVAALLLAVSPFHIYYSQEVRMYGLVTLLGLATCYFACVRRSWAWLGYVLAATAALYTQYYAAFLILALNLVVLFWLWARSRRIPGYQAGRDLFSWLAAQVAVVALYLPWLLYAGGKLLAYVRYKVVADQDLPLDPFTYLARRLAAFAGGHAEGALAGWWWLGLIPLLLLSLALLVYLVHRPRVPESINTSQNAVDGADRGGAGTAPTGAPAGGRTIRSIRSPNLLTAAGTTSPIPASRGAGWTLCLVIVALTLVCGYLVNLAFPFNPPRSERLLLLALPAFFLLFAAALLALWRWLRLLALVPASAFFAVALLSLGFFYSVPRYPDDDYRPVAARLQALALPSDAVVCVHPWQVGYFESYLPAPRPTLVLTPREVIPQERQLWADDPALLAAGLQQLLAPDGSRGLAGHGRLWLPAHETMGRVLEEQIEAYLVEHAYPTLAEWYGEHTLLSLFAAGEPVPQPVQATFGRWLALDGASLTTAPLEAGWGVLGAILTWRPVNPPFAADLTVGLRLVDTAGRVWAKRDSLPLVGSFSQWANGQPTIDRHGLLVPAGTPPGDYQVTLRLYRPPDSVLPATFAGGSGGEVTLGTVHIVLPQVLPPVAAMEIDRPLRVDWRPLRLLGFDLPGPGSEGGDGSRAYRPGEAIDVELFWQALAAPGEDYLPRLQLLDSAGTLFAELAEKPVAGAYPTAWWQAGELVRDTHALPVPAATPPGRYRLVLSLVRAADGSGRTSIDLAEIEVQARDHHYEPPAPAHVQAVQFGSAIELAGYDLAEAVYAPASSLRVTLYWHALQTPDKDYRVFVHLLDSQGQIVAQHDGAPDNGELPTLGWLPGEYLSDTHRLALPPTLRAGAYRLLVGLYDPTTRQRLAEPVLLDTPVIVSPD